MATPPHNGCIGRTYQAAASTRNLTLFGQARTFMGSGVMLPGRRGETATACLLRGSIDADLGRTRRKILAQALNVC
jgi:hypothetical protein